MAKCKLCNGKGWYTKHYYGGSSKKVACEKCGGRSDKSKKQEWRKVK